MEIGARLAEATRAYDEQGSDGEDVEDAILGSSMATEISELSTIFVSIEAVKEKMRTLETKEEEKRIQHALRQDDLHDDKKKLKMLKSTSKSSIQSASRQRRILVILWVWRTRAVKMICRRILIGRKITLSKAILSTIKALWRLWGVE